VHGSLASATAGCREHDLAFSQAGARSFIIIFDVYAGIQAYEVRSLIITFDVYVIPNIFEKYNNRRPDPLCPSASFCFNSAIAFASLSINFSAKAIFAFCNSPAISLQCPQVVSEYMMTSLWLVNLLLTVEGR